MSRVETDRVFSALLETGAKHNLGGTGEPAAIVVIYPGGAFVKAGWTRDHGDAVHALTDAMADEMAQAAKGDSEYGR